MSKQTDEDYAYLKKVHNSLCKADENLQLENRQLQDENKLLSAKLINLESALMINKNTLMQVITEMNKLRNEAATEIARLNDVILTLRK